MIRKAFLVLDSSFNPPTLAHSAMLKKAMELYPSHQPILMLSTTNADKGSLDQQDQQNRLEMMKTFEIPIKLTNQPFFIEKAKLFSEDERIVFVVGQDTLERILNPKYYASGCFLKDLDLFFQRSTLLCFKRGEKDLDFTSRWKDKIEIEEKLPGNYISSTIARDAIKCGKNENEILKLISFKIWDIIERKKLYSAASI